MPRGTEREPGPYALEVAAALAVIAGKLRLSNRALAARMEVGEKYIRDRIKKTAAVSFTVSDVERFSGIAQLAPEVFLNDPAGEAERYPEPVSEGGAIVTNIEERKLPADIEKVKKKAANRDPDMRRDEES